jgi:3-oxoacyl-[acyl-carrier protein] reductase
MVMTEESGLLRGRRVLVTGGATGIGAAAVEVLAREGAEVAAVYHRSPPPDHLADAACWFTCDMRVKSEVDSMFAATVDALGAVDVLLHAAGLWQPATPESLTEDDLDFLIATNLKATVFANQAAFEHMKERGGAIINMGSSEGVNANPGAPHYSATKAAVHAWTRACAKSWGRHGITVNALAPAVETPGADRLRAHVGEAGAAMMEAHLPSVMPIAGSLGPGKLGDPVDDLGPMIVFLAGHGARFITGQLLAVDGGIMM